MPTGTTATPSLSLENGNATTGRTRCAACACRDLCIVGSLAPARDGLGPEVREHGFRQGESLSLEGALSGHIRIVKTGMVFVCRRGSRDSSRPVAMAGSGTAFGICSFLDQPNQVSAVAASSGRYCELDAARVRLLARHDAEFRALFQQHLVQSVSTLARWAEALGRRGTVTQVANVIGLLAATSGSATLKIPSHTALAEMLGTSRESVARALATLESAGCVVKASLRHYRVDPQALGRWRAGDHPPSDPSQSVQASTAEPRPGATMKDRLSSGKHRN